MKEKIQSLLRNIESDEVHSSDNVLELANLYRDSKMYNEAIKQYDVLIRMNPLDDERTWYGIFQKGMCRIYDKHAFCVIQNDLMDAFNCRVWRLESLYYLIKYLREQGNVTTAYWLGRMLGNATYPTGDTIGLEKDIYDWKFYAEMRLCSWFSGQKDDAREYYERVMKHPFSDEDKEIVETNLKLA